MEQAECCMVTGVKGKDRRAEVTHREACSTGRKDEEEEKVVTEVKGHW